MTARSHRVGSVAGFLVLVAACAGRKAPTPAAVEPPALTTTREDLVHRVRDLAARGQVWTTKADLDVVDLETGQRRSVQVRMAARKPNYLRMQGTKTLLPTLFVLVANPEGVWLDVPPRKKTYLRPAGTSARTTAGAARSLMAIDPEDILRALVPDAPELD